MRVVILSPEAEIYAGEASRVKVPGSGGQFEILNGHAAIVSSLQEGVVAVREESGKDFSVEIKQGFIEVLNNEVAVLVVPKEA